MQKLFKTLKVQLLKLGVGCSVKVSRLVVAQCLQMLTHDCSVQAAPQPCLVSRLSLLSCLQLLPMCFLPRRTQRSGTWAREARAKISGKY